VNNIKGLNLPTEVIDRIYFKNIEKVFVNKNRQ